jgi:heme-degrading monooxygenase HmoA
VFVRIWQYEVVTGREDEFARVYAGDAPWAQLFARSGGFLGTELFRSLTRPGTFVTVDRFTSADDFRWLLDQHGASYAELDRAAAPLTLNEQEIATADQPESSVVARAHL